VVFPIYQGTVYETEPGAGYHDLKYIRLNSTPSQQYLHGKLAAIEGAEAAVATSSGMAAVTTILLSLMRAGDHLIASECLYGGTHDFLTSRRPGLTCSFVDAGRPGTWKPRALADQGLSRRDDHQPADAGRAPDRVAEFAPRGDRHCDRQHVRVAGELPPAPGTSTWSSTARPSPGRTLTGRLRVVMGGTDPVERRKTINLFGGSLDPRRLFSLARASRPCVRVGAERQRTGAGPVPEDPAVAAVNYPGLASHPDHAHAAELCPASAACRPRWPHGGEEPQLADAMTRPGAA
jgi:cystathionine gamma-synthase/cystathionine gamma-lyase/cystathionine beta-lyase